VAATHQGAIEFLGTVVEAGPTGISGTIADAAQQPD